MVEPIGPERDDYRIAYAVAGLAAMWASEPEDVDFRNFMIDWLNDPASEIEKALNVSPEMVERMEARLKARIMSNDPASPPRKKPKHG